jgi:hypothetical protein
MEETGATTLVARRLSSRKCKRVHVRAKGGRQCSGSILNRDREREEGKREGAAAGGLAIDGRRVVRV